MYIFTFLFLRLHSILQLGMKKDNWSQPSESIHMVKDASTPMQQHLAKHQVSHMLLHNPNYQVFSSLLAAELSSSGAKKRWVFIVFALPSAGLL